MLIRYFISVFLIFPLIRSFAQTDSPFKITKGFYNIVDIETGEKQFNSNYNFLDFYGSSSIFIAKKDSKYGLIDSNEAIILPFEYDTILFKRLKNDRMKVNIPYGFIKKNDLYGMLDSMGNLTTPIHFDQLPKVYNHWGVSCSSKGKFGAISLYGETLVPFEYDRLVSIDEGEFSIVSKNEKYGVYKLRESLVVPIEFERVKKYFKDPLFVVKKEKKEGLYNQFGELKLPIIYDAISYANGYNGKNWLKAASNKLYGIVNSKGELILPVEFEHVNGRHPKGFIVKKKGLYGIVDENGDIIVPIEYQNIDFRTNPRFNINLEARRTELRGFVILEDGTHFDTTAFDDYHKFLAEYIVLKKGKKYRLADWYGNIKPGAYDRIDCHYKTHKCVVNNDDLFGLIDYQGNLILPLKYRGISHLGFDLKYMAFFDENNNAGVMNQDGVVILPPKYQDIEYFEDALKDPVYWKELAFHVKSEGKWGLVSSKGKWLIPPEYDQLYYFNNGLAPARKDSLWGVIDKNNAIVTPFQYKNIRLSTEGIKEILIEDKWIKVNKKGIPIKE